MGFVAATLFALSTDKAQQPSLSLETSSSASVLPSLTFHASIVLSSSSIGAVHANSEVYGLGLVSFQGVLSYVVFPLLFVLIFLASK